MSIREDEIEACESPVLVDCLIPNGASRLRHVLVGSTLNVIQERLEQHLRVDLAFFPRIVHEGAVVLERPRDPVPLLDERMGELLGHEPAHARSPQVPHDDQGSPGGALDVQLRDLPRGPVVFRGVGRRSGVAHVELQRPVLEAGEAPSVLMPALVRRPDGAHPLCREVRELLEEVVVHRALADDAQHAAHARRDSARAI